MFPPNSDVEVLTSNVTAVGDGAYEEVTNKG